VTQVLIGLSSIIAFKSKLQDAFEIASRCNLSHVNIFCSPPHFSLKEPRKTLIQIRKIVRDKGLSLSIKAPSFAQNLASLDDEISNMTFNQFLRCIEIANELDSEFIVIRAGMLFYPEKIHSELSRKLMLERLMSLLEIANDSGISILIENYPYPIDAIRSLSDFYDLFSGLRYHPKLGIALNIAHAIVARFDVNSFVKDSRLVSRTRMIYVGPPPSPWHIPYNLRGLPRVVKLASEVLKHVQDAIVTIATLREELLKKILSGLRWGVQ